MIIDYDAHILYYNPTKVTIFTLEVYFEIFLLRLTYKHTFEGLIRGPKAFVVLLLLNKTLEGS